MCSLVVSGNWLITIEINTRPYWLVSMTKDFKFLAVDSTLLSNSLLFYNSQILLTGKIEKNWMVCEVIKIYLLPNRFCESSTACW